MDKRQIELVQSSWAKVEPIADDAAKMFYTKLFDLNPALQDLFPDDLGEQRKKLMATIGMAVKGLAKIEELVPALKKLGAGHAAYGVVDADYGTVADALLWTLGQGLGGDFTDECRDAWVVVYTVLADTMKSGASAAAA